MSRSYKHTPRCGEQKAKFAKRWANRRVRYLKDQNALPQHAGYKKLFCSWTICDYQVVGETFGEFYADIVRWNSLYQRPIPSRAEAKKQYDKWYIRK